MAAALALIAILAGDGIGPEVAAQARRVLDAAGGSSLACSPTCARRGCFPAWKMPPPGVHMAVLSLFYLGLGTSFLAGQIIATVAAMTFNFFLNNALTYRDRRLKGWRQMVDGWVSFCAVCAVGAVANVGIAAFLNDARSGEWAASAVIGVLIGAVWNFALSSRFTWGRY